MGADLRVVVTGPTWGVTFGAAIPTETTLEFDAARVRQARYPFDVSARIGWALGSVRGSLDLGLLAAVFRLRADDLPAARSSTRVEEGVRLAATWELERPSITPYVRAFAEVVPITHEIALEPQGSIGRTSPVWMGASLGIAGKFH
jgi:hypothetical protein